MVQANPPGEDQSDLAERLLMEYNQSRAELKELLSWIKSLNSEDPHIGRKIARKQSELTVHNVVTFWSDKERMIEYDPQSSNQCKEIFNNRISLQNRVQVVL